MRSPSTSGNGDDPQCQTPAIACTVRLSRPKVVMLGLTPPCSTPFSTVVPEDDEPVLIGNREAANEHRSKHREHGDGHADPDTEDEHRRHGKCPRAAE